MRIGFIGHAGIPHVAVAESALQALHELVVPPVMRAVAGALHEEHLFRHDVSLAPGLQRSSEVIHVCSSEVTWLRFWIATVISETRRAQASRGAGARIVVRETGSAVSCWEDRLDADTRVVVIGYVLTGDDGALRLAGRGDDPLVIANVSAAFE